MSGLEVVGVVLGVLGGLPVAVDTLKGYRRLLSAIKNVDRELRLLIQDLETEQVRLRTSCEILLEGVAPYSVIDELIENPFGPGWKPYKDQLRLRLWSSTPRFEQYVSEMQAASMELNAKLNIQIDGKTNLHDRTAILRELKRGAAFTLRKRDYEDVIERIRTGNSILHDLINQSCGLEPSRQRRSQARLIKLIRGLALGLFQAIQNATTCCCIKAHNICMELVPRNTVIVPSDMEDDIAKSFSFYMALDIGKNTQSGEATGTGLEKVQRWERFSLRPGKFNTIAINQAETHTPVALQIQKPPRRVGWSSSFTSHVTNSPSTFATQTLIDVSKTLLSIPKIPPQSYSLLSNLCHDLPRQRKMPARDCHGYITDSQREFGVYLHEETRESHVAVTLRQLLTDERSRSRFNCLEKLQVALAITASVLHLYKTPWLPRTVTLDDFVFLQESVSLLSGPDALDRPFITKSISHRPASQAPSQFRPVNLTMLSLGVLLIQVIIGRTVEELDVVATSEMDMNIIIAKYEASSRLSDRVLENGGSSYAAIVKWCLDNVFSLANLDDENFCQTFYNEVVARLEEDVGYLEKAVF